MTVESANPEEAAQNIEVALAAWKVAITFPRINCLADLIADLLHLADAYPRIFESRTGDQHLATAVLHYHAERDGGDGPAPVSVRGYTGGPCLPPRPDQALRDAYWESERLTKKQAPADRSLFQTHRRPSGGSCARSTGSRQRRSGIGRC